MKIEMKAEKKQVVIDKSEYTITLDKEAFLLFAGGIGNTSHYSRKEAGMTNEQARFFTDLYGHLHDDYFEVKD